MEGSPPLDVGPPAISASVSAAPPDSTLVSVRAVAPPELEALPDAEEPPPNEELLPVANCVDEAWLV